MVTTFTDPQRAPGVSLSWDGATGFMAFDCGVLIETFVIDAPPGGRRQVLRPNKAFAIADSFFAALSTRPGFSQR